MVDPYAIVRRLTGHELISPKDARLLTEAVDGLIGEIGSKDARIAELEAEIERLRNMLNGYGKLDAELAIAERRIEALSRTGAVKVKALEWEEITRARSNEDPSREVVGWEASEAVSASYYTVELTGGGASMTDPDYDEKHYDDPDVAKAAAQADFERRILSALEPAAPESQQPEAEALELSGNTGELIDKMAEAIRGDTTSDDTPWATLSEDRKEGWIGDAERALAVVKEYLTARRPTERAVTEAWRPIETAPKDGTQFQAWIEKYGWEPRARFNPDSEAFELWGRVDYDKDGWDVYPRMVPTHWMPFPTPPTAGGGDD